MSVSSPFTHNLLVRNTSPNLSPYCATAAASTSATVSPGTTADEHPAASLAAAKNRTRATWASVLPAVPCETVSSMTSTRILVLRHGESEWNALGKWQGQADPPLTDEGREQAFRAAERLGSFDVVACSDLQRAQETATIISNSIGVGPLQVDERYRETHVGEWQGLTHKEIEAQWPGWLAEHKRPDSFESDESLITRFTAALADTAQLCTGGTGLVIAHAGIIRVMRRALGVPDPRIPNLGGCEFILSVKSGRHQLDVGDVVELLAHGPVSESL